MNQTIQFLLRAEEMPTHWYNLNADYPEPLPPPLDCDTKSDSVSDMTTTVREFQRKFSRMRRVAAAGKEIRIRDQKTGEEFSFKAAKPEKKRTFWELAGHLAGSVKGGPSDLSTNKKYMEGFGRDSGHR